MVKVAALFVQTNGCYFSLPGVDPWDIHRDARFYDGPYTAILHPPCERWGRYWFGGPSVRARRELGDDGGCFEAAVRIVRKWGGVIEHPKESKAFKHFGLPIPKRWGGWTFLDEHGGRSCCVDQGHYGHLAQKSTWLYGVGISFAGLHWGESKGHGYRLDEGYHSAEERRRAIRTGVCQRLSKKQRAATPIPFRDLLLSLVRGC